MISLRILIVLIAFGASGLQAKTFSNQYTQFDLPAGWQCAIEGSEWVCQSENADRKKEAIIILAAKYRGEKDSLADYQLYLKGDKTYQLPGGKTQRSEPKYTKMSSINGHQWVDALHLASEVPGFYTRYLATVKEDLGVAVTFSIRKDLYNSYQGIFDNVVKTLRVFRQKKQSLADLKLDKSGGNASGTFDDSTFNPDADKYNIGAVKKRSGSDEDSGGTGMLLIILAAVAGFIILKLKKKK
jgi:hypothetical protein